MITNSPTVKHLVLVGGGHSHLAVLKRLGMKPVPGLAVTLISREIYTPYSGSMPAYIAGHYELDDMHIDLRPLAQFAGVRLIEAEVQSIDFNAKIIQLPGRPNIPFDLVSLNIGSSPNGELIKGSRKYGISVKPINEFLNRWQKTLASALDSLRNEKPFSLVIVGGGPASVELAFAAQYKIHTSLELDIQHQSKLKIHVVSNSKTVLSTHNDKAQKAVLAEFKKRHIEFIPETYVSEIDSAGIHYKDGGSLAADSVVYATGASIPQWPANCGLNLSDDGFIEINNHLQSTSHPFVFAAGDAATIKNQPRPKSGVYAVRQGKVLAINLIKAATGKPLKKYSPQKHALALVNLGNKSALAIRNTLFFQGIGIWRLKDSIDRKFVRKYSELPDMDIDLAIAKGLVDKSTEAELKAHAMRCAGCGAKVAGNILEQVLTTLPRVPKDDVVAASGRVEDASQIDLGGGRELLQSIDQLKAFTNDPWLFAKIATNHCLSDIYAMGVKPHSALAIAGIPQANQRYTRSQLSELMHGCAQALAENDCALIGGHSAETNELQFGLCVNGFTDQPVLSKGGVNSGDVFILTKPLGTGTLLAADMRYKASHFWIKEAIQSMLIPNKNASEILVSSGATACTDITGFGLAGHLLEMLESRNAEAEIDLNLVPALPGAIECLSNGITSSLHRDNALAMTAISNPEPFSNDSRLQLLFDPQTSGGLLACVKSEEAAHCLRELLKAGYADAKIIGNVASTGAKKPAIILK
jgi:selenide,water dikinase